MSTKSNEVWIRTAEKSASELKETLPEGIECRFDSGQGKNDERTLVIAKPKPSHVLYVRCLVWFEEHGIPKWMIDE